MALISHKHRENLVGKWYLLLNSAEESINSDISNWNWQFGVVRAASCSDLCDPELSVCIEPFGVNWQDRQWLELRDCCVFLVENTLSWACCDCNPSTKCVHKDPNLYNYVVLTFSAIVDNVGLKSFASSATPVLSLPSRRIGFLPQRSLREFQSTDLDHGVITKPEIDEAVRSWLDYQSGQHLLVQTPSVLIGYRVQVYRTEGTTQWYTAVINSYDENTKELHVTDDTVLQAHTEDPRLVQITLLGEGVLESILRGDDCSRQPRTRSSKSRTAAFSSNQAAASRRLGRQQQLRQQTKNRDSKSPSSLSTCSSRGSSSKWPKETVKPATSFLKETASPSSSIASDNSNTSPAIVVGCRETSAVDADSSPDRDKKSSKQNRMLEQINFDGKTNFYDASSSVLCSPLFPVAPHGDVVIEKSSNKSLAINASSLFVHDSDDPKKGNGDSATSLSRDLTSIPTNNQTTAADGYRSSNSNAKLLSIQCNSVEKCNALPVIDNTNEKSNMDGPVTDSVIACNQAPSARVEPFKADKPYKKRHLLSDGGSGMDTVVGEDLHHSQQQLQQQIGDQQQRNQSLNCSRPKASDLIDTTIVGIIGIDKDTFGRLGNIDVSKPVTEQVTKLWGRKAGGGTDFGGSDGEHSSRSYGSSPLNAPPPPPQKSDDLPASSMTSISTSRSQSPANARGNNCGSLSNEFSALPGKASKRKNPAQAQSDGHDPTMTSVKDSKVSESSLVASRSKPVVPYRDPTLLLRDELINKESRPLKDGNNRTAEHRDMPNSLISAAATSSNLPLSLLQATPAIGAFPPSIGQQQQQAMKPSVSVSSVLQQQQNSAVPLLAPYIAAAGAFNPTAAALALNQNPFAQYLQLLEQHQQQQQQPNMLNAAAAALATAERLYGLNPLLMQQLTLLWRQKYPTTAVPPPWMLFQYQEELMRGLGTGGGAQAPSASVAAVEREQQYEKKVKSEGRLPPNMSGHMDVTQHVSTTSSSPFDGKKADGRERVRETRTDEGERKDRQSSKAASQHHRPTERAHSNVSSTSSWQTGGPSNNLQQQLQAATGNSMGDVIETQVDHHFEESLRLANQKTSAGSNVSSIRDGNKALAAMATVAAVGGSGFGNMLSSKEAEKDLKVQKFPQFAAGDYCKNNNNDQPKDYTSHLSGSQSKMKHQPMHSSQPSHPGPTATSLVGEKEAPLFSLYGYQPMSQTSNVPPPLDLQRGDTAVSLEAEHRRSERCKDVPVEPARGVTVSRGVDYETMLTGSVCRPPSTSVIVGGGSHHSKTSKTTDNLMLEASSIKREFDMPKPMDMTQWSSSMHYHAGTDVAQDLSQPKLNASSVASNLPIKPPPPIQQNISGIISPAGLAENLTMAVNGGINGLSQMMFGPMADVHKIKRKRSKKEDTSKGMKLPKLEPGADTNFAQSVQFPNVRAVDNIPASAVFNNNNIPIPMCSTIGGDRVMIAHNYFQEIVDNTVHSAFKQEQEIKDVKTSTSSDSLVVPSFNQPVSSNQASMAASSFTASVSPSISDIPSPQMQPASSVRSETVPATIASIEETINRVAEGLFDADSDTLSAPSPQNLPQSSSTDSVVTASLQNNRKVLKKAWMQRYNGDCSASNSNCGQTASDSADSQSSPFTRHPTVQWNFDSGSTNKDVNSVNLNNRDDLSTQHNRDSNKIVKMDVNAESTKLKEESETKNRIPDLKAEEKDVDKKPSALLTPAASTPVEMSDCEKKMLNRKKSGSSIKKDASGADEDKPVNKSAPPKGSKNSDIFLQDGSCVDVTPRLKKCRECRLFIEQRHRKQMTNFCRFYAFRRLSYNAKGTLVPNGFLEPMHADTEDIELWFPDSANLPDRTLNVEMAKYVISHVADRFAELFEQENLALSWMNPGTKIVWKRAVQRVREMCDVCDTTLFNLHWVCEHCGFVVCVDCYRVKVRKGGKCADSKCVTCELGDQRWITCTSNNRQPHGPESLTVTQIIPSDVLVVLNRLLKEVVDKHHIRSVPPCRLNILEEVALELTGAERPIQNGFDMGSLPAPKLERFNGTDSTIMSPLSMLAEAAESIELKQPPKLTNSNDSSVNSRGKKSKDTSTVVKANGLGENDYGKGGELSLRDLAVMKKKKRALEDLSTSKVTSDDSHGDTKMVQFWKHGKGGKACKAAKLEVLRPATLLHFRSKTGSTVYEEREGPLPQYSVKDTSPLFPTIPHDWLDHGRLLWLQDPLCADNVKLFQQQWRRAQPVLISGCHRQLKADLWKPQKFGSEFGSITNDLVNCQSGVVLLGHKMKVFWDGFERISARLKDKGKPLILKLKDWPPGDDFSDMLPTRFQDLMDALPMPEYTQRNGRLNLASCLPDFFVRPDLGPKMYNAYGSAATPRAGTTNLHLDISDAVNLLLYVGIPEDDKNGEETKATMQAIEDAGCCDATKKRVRQLKPGALWHIFDPHDSDKIRDLLNKVAKENGETVESHHDPIHDQSWYLDEQLRDRLQREYGVVGYTIVQCLGDAIFIPAGAPHQVRNLHSCIKAAEDFVSPENLQYCFKLTQEFRHLSDKHSNHEDKLQVKNIIYHAIKDAVAVLRAESK